MAQESIPTSNKQQFFDAFFIPLILGIIMILTFILEKGMDWDFHTAGVYPRRLENLWGIFTLIFIHADWSHLANNVISFVLLAGFLYYFYNQIATQVLVISYISSGFILWIIGRESWHIGASGLIYSIAFFLFFSGIFRKHVPLIALSFIIAFIYGGMIWHIFPWQIQDPVSWEGHLAGGSIGFILSICYRKIGPQKPIKVWEEEDDNEGEDSLDYQIDDDEELEKEIDHTEET